MPSSGNYSSDLAYLSITLASGGHKWGINVESTLESRDMKVDLSEEGVFLSILLRDAYYCGLLGYDKPRTLRLGFCHHEMVDPLGSNQG